MAEFRCHNCGECCGPVPFSQSELLSIMDVLRKMPREATEGLAAQQRGELTCMFRDMKAQCCAVYSARPLLCRMFGLYEGLVCPRNLLVQRKPRSIGDPLAEVYAKSCCGVLGVSIGWKDILEAL